MSVTLTHCGLPEGMSPFELLDVLQKLRNRLGLRDEDLAYLRCAFRLVRSEDFLPGRVCGFWEKVSGLADRLGFNVRRITRIETRLEACGLIRRTGAANGKRFGRRAEDGQIISVGGINLAPLIECAGEFLIWQRSVAIGAERLKDDRLRANDLIRQIRNLDAPEALVAAREAFPRLRPSEVQDGERLTAIIAALEAIVTEFSANSGRTVEVAPSDSSVRPNTNPKKKIETCRRHGDAAHKPLRISTGQVLALAGEELREAIELYAEADGCLHSPSWRCIGLGARERAMMLGVSGSDWDAARDSLGEMRTSLCLLLADCNAERTDRFRVRNAARAFIGLVRQETRGKAVSGILTAELIRGCARRQA